MRIDPSPHAVIFDMDGTLLDTERLARTAMSEACASLGFAMTEELQLSLVGTPKDDENAKLQARFGPAFPVEAYHDHVEAFISRRCELENPLKPGADALLRLLRERGIPTGVATSTSRSAALRRLHQAGVGHLVDALITRTDVLHGKPHPETYLAAAMALGAPPNRCLAIEDSYIGVRSAVAAGMPTVMVPDLLCPTDEMRRICVSILPTLATLHEMLEWEAS